MKKVWYIQLAMLLGLAGLISSGMVLAKANTDSSAPDSPLLYNQAVLSQPVIESASIDPTLLTDVEFQNPTLANPQLVDHDVEDLTAPISELTEPEPLPVTGVITESTESAGVVATPSPTAVPTEKPTAQEETKSTPKPTVEPTKKPTETAKPTVTPTEKPKTESPEPTTAPKIVSGGLNADKIFDLVNQYRASKGLPAQVKDDKVCALAQSRAPEIHSEIYGGVMHSGLKKRNLDYRNMENIISMRTEEEAVRWWINDYIHRVQMEADNKYSCVACSGNSCAQEFTNYEPK